MATAIREMHVRGAGLIGASAGYGMYLAAIEATARSTTVGIDEQLARAAAQLKATRPTAVNLSWAVERQLGNVAKGKNAKEKVGLALRTARSIADEDAEHCRMIGQHGLELIRQLARKKAGKFAMANPSGGGPINVLTHCNAGWLAFVDYGSATAPIMQLTTVGCRFTCGSRRRDQEIRAPNLQPGSWANTVCRIRSS